MSILPINDPKIQKILQDSDVSSKDPDKKNVLDDLLNIESKIFENAQKEIVFSEPLVKRGDVPILSRGTVNMIQGKYGSHKSRLAEFFMSLVLKKPGVNTDFLEFEKNTVEAITGIYIDTERSLNEEVPFAIQNISEKAGYRRTEKPPNFRCTSIKLIARKERLEATKAYIEAVRQQDENHLFVVMDVITDCVRSFNDDSESLELVDYMGRLAEENDTTFLLVIHENPGNDKARGHTGTETTNKSGTTIQIGYLKDNSNNDTDVIKVTMKKVRRAKRPEPIYLTYDEQTRGLILADDELVKGALESKKKITVKDLEYELSKILITPMNSKVLLENLSNRFACHANTIRSAIKEILGSGGKITGKDNVQYHLQTSGGKGTNPKIYSIEKWQNDD